MELSDLVSLPIQEFYLLLNQCQVNTEKVRQLEAELTVHKMINLNQQQMIRDIQLTNFFKQLEVTDVIALLQANFFIWNKNKSPRIITCYQYIKGCKKSISMGLVHEIFININHPEEYEDILYILYVLAG